MVKIEIIAVGKNKIYSVGYIRTNKKGDIYHISKAGNTDTHYSRHVSGETHIKSRQSNILLDAGKRIPIKEYKGIEFFGTTAFGLSSLPEVFKEYKMKKSDGIFSIDMREYKDGSFNMTIAILTEEGLPTLLSNWSKYSKRQIYLFVDHHPMIAIMVCDTKQLAS